MNGIFDRSIKLPKCPKLNFEVELRTFYFGHFIFRKVYGLTKIYFYAIFITKGGEKMNLYPETIVFVRHAESEGNLLSVEERVRLCQGTNLYALTARGRVQAMVTRRWLAEHFPNPDRIIRSYYRRVAETADAIYPDLPKREDERLAEANRGIWHVRTEARIAIEAPFEIDRRKFEGLYHYRPIGGENWLDIEGRIRSFRNSICKCYPNQTIVVVTHGFWLLLWQKLVHRWSIEEALEKYQAGAVVDNASVLIYHGTVVKGRSVLTHDPATDYIRPVPKLTIL